eukprot:Rmarinus@m.9591
MPSNSVSSSHSCCTPGCEKPASLRCPTCTKMNIPNSYFCSQDCFKSQWKSHKRLHVLDPWSNFEFTGSLRPAKVSKTRTVPDHIPRPDYAEDGVPHSEQTSKANKLIVHTPEQIAGVREACRVARDVLDIAGRAVKPGVTADEIDEIVHNAMVERNAYPSPLNYHGFPKSCCTSVNEVICHGIPDSRPFEEGDIVNLDITAYYKGFHGDTNETFYVGKVDEESKMLVETAYECLHKALELVKPGALFRELGPVIDKHARSKSCSVVRSYCGHGINEMFHCAPSVPHYAKNKAIGVMKPGMIFAIEPMINLGSWRDVTWPDDWTAVTQDGKRSAQFEHTVVVTEDGCEVLTARRKGVSYQEPFYVHPTMKHPEI